MKKTMNNRCIQQFAAALPVAIRNLTDMVSRSFDKNDLGLNLVQLGLLEMVAGNEDPVQSMLADQLCIDKSAILRHVDVLESKGWLERRVDPKDRRRKHLVISELGNTVLQNAIDRRNSVLQQVAVGLSRTDIETAANVLEHMAGNSQVNDGTALQ